MGANVSYTYRGGLIGQTTYQVDSYLYALGTLNSYFADEGGFFAAVRRFRREHPTLSSDESIRALIREAFPTSR